MTQNINIQSSGLTFSDLENYVKSDIQGDNDKRVLKLADEGSFQVSTTDKRYAFSRSDEDKKANTATRAAVLDALKGIGLDMNNLSDKMKSAMKYEDFNIVNGKVTSTHPLSALRLKAIVTQAKAEITAKVAQQIENKPELAPESALKLDRDFAQLVQQIDNIELEGGMEGDLYKKSHDLLYRLQAIAVKGTSKNSVLENLNKIKDNMTVLTDLAEKAPKELLHVVMQAHDIYVSIVPELKDVPEFDESFRKLACKAFVSSPKDIQEHVLVYCRMYDSICDLLSNGDTREITQQEQNKTEYRAVESLSSQFKSLCYAKEADVVPQKIDLLKDTLKNAEQKIGGIQKMSSELIKVILELRDKHVAQCPQMAYLPGFEAVFLPYVQEAKQREVKVEN